MVRRFKEDETGAAGLHDRVWTCYPCIAGVMRDEHRKESDLQSMILLILSLIKCILNIHQAMAFLGLYFNVNIKSFINRY